jgi:hypothetical protein
MGDSKEKIGNAIDRLDLLRRPFINHGDYGGSSPVPWIRDDLLVGSVPDGDRQDET